MPVVLLQDLIGVTAFCAQQGWTPATSSNFSVRCPQSPFQMWITASGKDKGALLASDFIATTLDGQPVVAPSPLPSAETRLHGVIYQAVPWAQCVLHTHSLAATLVSKEYESAQAVTFSQMEILKGLRGVMTHDTSVSVPVLSNDQDMTRLSQVLASRFDETAEAHGFLLAGHGVYVWGQTPAEARRHLEVLEFLFQCQLNWMHHGRSHYSG